MEREHVRQAYRRGSGNTGAAYEDHVWLIGSRLPMVTGISFTYVAAAMSIAQHQGYGAVAGAVVVSFKLSRKAKICTIDTVEDYHRLMRKYAKPKYENSEYSSLFKEKVIDWKKLSKDYDAFHLTERAFWEMRLPLSNILECEDGSELCNFYSYDCESWILFSLDCINWGSVINQDVKIKPLYDD